MKDTLAKLNKAYDILYNTYKWDYICILLGNPNWLKRSRVPKEFRKYWDFRNRTTIWWRYGFFPTKDINRVKANYIKYLISDLEFDMEILKCLKQINITNTPYPRFLCRLIQDYSRNSKILRWFKDLPVPKRYQGKYWIDQSVSLYWWECALVHSRLNRDVNNLKQKYINYLICKIEKKWA